MEVCGSHTQAIGRHGIRQLLPSTIRLVSGPGCPVCVTSVEDVDRSLFLAGQENVILATFGDMLRVPGTDGASLQKLRAAGADIRVVPSARDCLDMAVRNPAREVVFLGIGFETTSPTVAAAVREAARRGITNVSVFSVHKVIPPAMAALIDDPTLAIDGFLCPGHVSTIIGADAYRFVASAGRTAVITGFEPVDILEGILMILRQFREERRVVEIQYARGVTPAGNRKAREILAAVFQTADSAWRGLGVIGGSGLCFRSEYAVFDATRRFAIPPFTSQETQGCACGDILRGAKTPAECPLFGKGCTPREPVGPCMVSSEGTCAAFFHYGSLREEC
jgi:hydrogenase expression/formation protein HypD